MGSGSRIRNWLFFYLICLVGLLWATFLMASGGWFWVSIWVVISVVGMNIIILLFRFR